MSNSWPSRASGLLPTTPSPAISWSSGTRTWTRTKFWVHHLKRIDDFQVKRSVFFLKGQSSPLVVIDVSKNLKCFFSQKRALNEHKNEYIHFNIILMYAMCWLEK